jgi:NADPH2:quinone reductase
VRRIVRHGVDAIVEVSPAVNAQIDAAVIANGGSVAIYANNGGNEVTIPIRPSMTTNARWQFVLLYTVAAGPKAHAIEDVAGAVLDGAVRVGREAGVPLTHFPLEEASAAHAAVEAGAVGKVLIDVTD